jgi:Protein of unknown function (DUF4239)
MLNNGLPADTRAAVRSAVGEYIRFVQAIDWPRMAASRATLNTSPKGLTDVMALTFAITPASNNEALVQQRLVAALERALDGRLNRSLLSQGNISSIQWFVIVALDILMLIVVVMVHIDRFKTIAINTTILASAMACCLVLLMVHDRPFATGGFTLEP